MSNRNQSHRRGMAMLLVIISLMMATVLATAYLASRDNSTTIGENVASSTSARWAADSGVELAVAVLQTKTDWRTSAGQNGGRLLRNCSIGDGLVDVSLIDLTTGNPPGPNSENIQITSTGNVNGVRQVTLANAYVPLAGAGVDVDLSDFAAFVGSGLTMSNQSIITRWPMAPLSVLGRPIAIGIRSGSASSIVLSNSAAAIDTIVYAPPGASGSLISNAASPALTKINTLDLIPLPSPASSGESYNILTLTDLSMNGGTATVVTNSRYRKAEIRNNSVRTLRGNISMICDDELRIDSGGKIVIDGNVKVVVFGNLRMDQGAIELKPNANLRLYVRGSSGQAVDVKDSYIGEVRATSVRDNTGKAPWMDPQRITLFSIPPLLTAFDWLIEGNSVIKGSVYSPHSSKVTVKETSAIYGRVAAKNLEMRDSAALFYDHSLNSKNGYGTTTGPMYTADGHLLDAFKTLTTLEATDLQVVANLVGLIVKSNTGTSVQATPSGSPSESPDTTPVTEPTPRPVRVSFDLLAFGTNVGLWEH